MSVMICKVWYNAELLNKHLDKYFVFGDNTQGYGNGGQACIRDCDNSLGVPTKWAPGGEAEDYFDKTNNFFTEVVGQILPSMVEIEDLLEQGADVVFPQDGLGTGLAELPKRFPEIHKFICDWIDYLKSQYGEKEFA